MSETHSKGSPLSGRRILLVEDEYMIAEDLQQALEAIGAEVVGPAPTVADAMGLLDTAEIDLAILDVNLGGEYVWPLADALQARGVRFVFATGYDQSAMPARFCEVRRCEKPIDIRRLTIALLS